MQKVFEWTQETFFLEPNFIKFGALESQLTQLQSHASFIEFTVENKVWSSFSWITFESLDGNCNIIIVLLHLWVYMRTSSKWRFYKNCICRVFE